MVFKLIRVDVEEPCKIQLLVGTHLIGRGKFLHNDGSDKRVSRNHAVMEVLLDTVTLKSLHQNPCFYTKKNTTDTEILQQDNTISLGNGDKFGLLPECFWYEVIFCPDTPENVDPVNKIEEKIKESDREEEGNAIENNEQNTEETESTQIKNAEETLNAEGANSKDMQGDESTDSIEGPINKRDENNDAANNTDEAINFDMSEEAGDPNRSASPSLLTTESKDKGSTQESTLVFPEKLIDPVSNTFPGSSTDPGPSTPSKRTHESDTNEESSPVDVKRVKVEPAAQDAQPGPSNDQSASNSDSKDVKPDMGAAPPSPAKPAAPVRERCMYGVNCYRRNPQHKAQFSHPSDQDWGTGDQGVCPYGTRCRKTDIRHWQQNQHPPGTLPPDPNMPQRRGQLRKRQPRPKTVSISESDEDSPGNLIVTGKRNRKTIKRDNYKESDSDEEADPFNTDDSDEWQPSSDAPTSQDYSQYD